MSGIDGRGHSRSIEEKLQFNSKYPRGAELHDAITDYHEAVSLATTEEQRRELQAEFLRQFGVYPPDA